MRLHLFAIIVFLSILIPIDTIAIEQPVNIDLTSDIEDSNKQLKLVSKNKKKSISQEDISTESVQDSIDNTPTLKTQTIDQFSLLPIGLRIGSLQQPEWLDVYGQVSDDRVVSLEKWLLPFHKVMFLLKFEIKTLEGGYLELNGPGGHYKISASELQTSPDLGAVLSIARLDTLFGIKATVDLAEYTLILDADWLVKPLAASETDTADQAQKEHLPIIPAPSGSLSYRQQTFGGSLNGNQDPFTHSSLELGGSLFGTSWYIDIDQQDISDPKTWGLSALEIVRQTPKTDLYIGTHHPFWPQATLSGEEDFLGGTIVLRKNVVPPEPSGGAPSRERRRRIDIFSRSIQGQTEPEALVQLRGQSGIHILGEVIADQSGRYHFPDIKIEPRQRFQKYVLFIFLTGDSDEQPDEKREINLAGALPGQLPSGAIELTLSAGWRRHFSVFGSKTPLGDFEDLLGGASLQWGISDSVTLGFGLAYDQTLRGFAHLLWQPDSIPVSVSGSLYIGDEDNPLLLKGSILAEPTQDLSLQFVSDEFSRRFDFRWDATSELKISGYWDNNQPTTLRIGYFKRIQKDLSWSTSLTGNSDGEMKWRQRLKYKQFKFKSTIDNQQKASAAISYAFAKGKSAADHSLALSYNQKENQRLGSILWRYKSKQRANDGLPLWIIKAGYGIGSSGHGFIGSIETSIIPGLSLRTSYQQVSQTSDTDRFVIDIVSTAEFDKKFRPGNSQTVSDLRTLGGIIIAPFFDKNQNGNYDQGEKRHTDPNLLEIDHKPLDPRQIDTSHQQLKVKTPPGTYRVTLTPAGLPEGWQVSESSFYVEVSAGAYTYIDAPLVPSYTASGTVLRADGNIFQGAEIIAISESTGHKVTSITDRSGVYYLDGLKRDSYVIKINGKPSFPPLIKLDQNSDFYFELNLKQTD